MKVVDKESASKILRDLPSDNAFYFFTGVGQYIGEYATSLTDFCEKIKNIDLKSINFHHKRGDFEKWIRTTIGDAYLANRLKQIGKTLEGEKLRLKICQTIETRIKELKKIIAPAGDLEIT